MNILENVSLARYSTMQLGGDARYLAEASTAEEVKELALWAQQNNLKYRMIGGGSNIIWRDEGYDGLIIVNRLSGRQVVDQGDASATVHLASGEEWDACVAWSVEQNFSGIEFLSLIPGSVGAAPVQNIGAYGAELADCLLSVEAYDCQQDEIVSIDAADCGFAYRTSRFKTSDSGRFMILGISLKLSKSFPTPPFYEALQSYFDEKNIKQYTPTTIRQAVIAIRSSKLPDWHTVANNGSFFTNPFVTSEHFEELKQQYPDIKGWPTSDGRVKLAAGWLVEQAGFKGYHDSTTGMATWDQQALVLVNEHARNTKDLLEFKQKIVFKVDELFGVTLEQEPELLP